MAVGKLCVKCEGIVEYMKERSGADWKPPTEAMLVLTKDNFTEFTTREELIVVMFYAPWLVLFSVQTVGAMCCCVISLRTKIMLYVTSYFVIAVVAIALLLGC